MSTPAPTVPPPTLSPGACPCWTGTVFLHDGHCCMLGAAVCHEDDARLVRAWLGSG